MVIFFNHILFLQFFFFFISFFLFLKLIFVGKGVSGSGKSFVCKSIAQNFYEEEIWNDENYEFVFYVSLLPFYQEKEITIEMLTNYLWEIMAKKKINKNQKEETFELIRNKEKEAKVIWIFDDFDKFLCLNPNEIYNFFESLKNCVFITNLNFRLPFDVSLNLQLELFSKKEITEYFNLFFKKEEQKKKRCIEFLERNDNLKHLSSLPFFLHQTAEIFQNNLGNRFEEVNQIKIVHFFEDVFKNIVNEPKRKTKFKNLIKFFENERKFFKTVKKIISFICFHMFCENKQFIHFKEIAPLLIIYLKYPEHNFSYSMIKKFASFKREYLIKENTLNSDKIEEIFLNEYSHDDRNSKKGSFAKKISHIFHRKSHYSNINKIFIENIIFFIEDSNIINFFDENISFIDSSSLIFYFLSYFFKKHILKGNNREFSFKLQKFLLKKRTQLVETEIFFPLLFYHFRKENEFTFEIFHHFFFEKRSNESHDFFSVYSLKKSKFIYNILHHYYEEKNEKTTLDIISKIPRNFILNAIFR